MEPGSGLPRDEVLVAHLTLESKTTKKLQRELNN